MNVAGVLLVVLEAVMNTTGLKEKRLRVRAIVINVVDVHLNEVNNTVLLDEGCALGERDLQTVACVWRSWRGGDKEQEESRNGSELHLHCEEKVG